MENNWIKVEDRLPQIGTYVLCARYLTSMGGTKFHGITVAKLIRDDRWSVEIDWISIKYWMPLPEPPKD